MIETGKPVFSSKDHDIVGFVMARWQKSGGFGFAPTLPASIEDSYHGFRILKTMAPVSEEELRQCSANPAMKSFLMRQEGVENSDWRLRALDLLEISPLSLDGAQDFIARCKTRGGGFARKNGAAPFLYATWHAVAGLALLSRINGAWR